MISKDFPDIIQTCQASRIWSESPAFYLYLMHKFSMDTFFISSRVFISVAHHTLL